MLIKELLPPQPAEGIIYINGEFLPDSQAKISALDHGLMYGDGVFDAWCGRNGFIYELDAHLDRLYRSVHALKLDRWLKMPKPEMREKIIETVHRNVVTDFYIKVLVTRGISPHPVINPRECKEASVIIYARPTQYEVTPEKKERGSASRCSRSAACRTTAWSRRSRASTISTSSWASWKRGTRATTRR